MKHFLEIYNHPYCDIDCDIYVNPEEGNLCETSCPNCVYRYIDIRITVDCDIEKIEIGEEKPVSPTGVVWVEVVNNYDLQPGLEDWHNISGLLSRDNSVDCITITRSDTDTWDITVDTGEDSLFTFIEIYKGYWRKGKGSENKIPYWTITPFKFMTKWTRSPS